MPVDALRKSLPYERAEIKPTPAAQIEAARHRAAARMAVVCDTRLSPGARLLYVLLDDYAGTSGECWPGQETLATRLGASRRGVQEWIYELSGAGHLRTIRGQRGNRYVLAPGAHSGAHSGVHEAEVQCTQHGTPGAHGDVHRIRVLEFEPVQEPPATCRCDGSGYWLYESRNMDGSVRRSRIKCACAG